MHNTHTKTGSPPPEPLLLLYGNAITDIVKPTANSACVSMLTQTEQQHLLHRRAGHFGHVTLRNTADIVRNFDYTFKHNHEFCDSCPAGNSRYPTLNMQRTRASQVGEKVHCDLWGKVQTASHNGNRFVICFVDDYSRYIEVFFLKRKSEAGAALRKYLEKHSAPLELRIRTIQSDAGGEFFGDFQDTCRVNNIRQNFSAPDLQAQNSVAERTWGTLVSATLRMLEDAKLPASYFEDAMRTAAWIKNRVYSTAVKGAEGAITPSQAFNCEEPDLSILRVWGSPAYVHIPHGKKLKLTSAEAERKRKLDSKVRPAIFVGYTENQKSWTFYDPHLKVYFVSRMATFNERVGINGKIDSRPALTLLKAPQPDDLEISQLRDDLDAKNLVDGDGNDDIAPSAAPVEKLMELPNAISAATSSTAPPQNFTTPLKQVLQRSSLQPSGQSPQNSSCLKYHPHPPRHTVGSQNRKSTEAHGIPEREFQRREFAAAIGGSESTIAPATTSTKWLGTPQDGMTVRQIARYFNVDYQIYHKWLASFKPFGKGEELEISPVGKKKRVTRLEKGTEVPIPIKDLDFLRTRDAVEKERSKHSYRQRHMDAQGAASTVFAFALTVTAAYHTLATPKNYTEVSKSKERDRWWEAMNSEYTSLIGLGTWELVQKRPGDTVIGSMWAFKIKELADGSIDKYKARLVARGDQQKEGSYSEIFAPVIKFVTLRILLAIACVNDWDLQQVDIGNAYCNSEVTNEEILMHQPAGFKQYGPNGEELVCRLAKSLYGLKEAGRLWNSMLNNWLTQSKWKLHRCRSDHCLYYRNYKGKILMVGVYVDDLVITGNCPKLIREFKTDIGNRFKISDLGDLKWILGMEVVRDRKARRLTLHQRKYINDILELFNMQDCHPKATPADPSARLDKSDSPVTETEMGATDLTKYRQMVGKLVYLMVASEPIVAFAVSQLSRFFSCPGPSHFKACRWAISYLKGLKPDQGLTFSADNGYNLHAYCDSDWAGCPDTRRSTSGYVVMFGGAAVSWISKRQPTVALSSAEAEYVTACLAAQEVQWIRQLLAEIELNIQKGPTVVYSDSQSAMHMAANPTAGRAKHIDIKYHFVKEAKERGVVEFKYVNTSEQAADVFTKSLARVKLTHFKSMIDGSAEELHWSASRAP